MESEAVATNAGKEELFRVELLADLSEVGGAVGVAEGCVAGQRGGQIARKTSGIECEGLGCCCGGECYGCCPKGDFGEHGVIWAL